MTTDKSLFYYGWIYHKLFDPQLTAAREVTVDLVADGSSVLDIGCGTGELCFALKAKKHCRAVGVDLSLRMLRFAEKSNPYDDVKFLHLDAADLSDIADHSFDYATILYLIHELPQETQLRVLREAFRVADKIIIIDSNVPLPKNSSGRGVRIVEATFGRDHNRHFKSFLANSGIKGVLEYSGLPVTVVYRSVFWRGCREVVVLSKQ